MKKHYQAPATHYIAIESMSAILSASGGMKQSTNSYNDIYNGVLG